MNEFVFIIFYEYKLQYLYVFISNNNNNNKNIIIKIDFPFRIFRCILVDLIEFFFRIRIKRGQQHIYRKHILKEIRF